MIRIDERTFEITTSGPEGEQTFSLSSPEGFAVLSRAWLRVGWANRYSYAFTWFGRPIIQLPEDLIRLQELVYQVKPDVIVETGVAHGGSATFFASLCRMSNHGRVIAVDIEIRPHNRAALETHPFADRITLIEGDSIAANTIARVRSLIGEGETVLVFLDSNHSKAHVLAELHAYAAFVREGGYIVVADGAMPEFVGLPGAHPDWALDNPGAAIAAFVEANDAFERVPPPRPFDESSVPEMPSYWPNGYLRRVR